MLNEIKRVFDSPKYKCTRSQNLKREFWKEVLIFNFLRIRMFRRRNHIIEFFQVDPEVVKLTNRPQRVSDRTQKSNKSHASRV